MTANEPSGQPLVSVLIPVLNEVEDLERCLDSLVAQDFPADRLEILVVDSGSTDGTLQVLERWAARDPRLQRIRNPGSVVSAALNAGVRAARGEVLVRVDAHAVLAPDYVRQCLDTLRATGADNVGGGMHPTGTSLVGEAVARAMLHRFGVGTARFRFARRVEEVDTVYLGAFRRDVFTRFGPFNESLVRNQDYELNYRIRRGGGRVVVNPAIRATYRPRPTMRGLWRQYFDYGYWKLRMLRQHPRSLRPRQLVAPAFVLALALGAVLCATAAIAGGGAAAALPLAAVAGSYAAANLMASAAIAARHGWRLLPLLPPVFVTMHLAWGSGFLWSLLTLRPAVRRAHRAAATPRGGAR